VAAGGGGGGAASGSGGGAGGAGAGDVVGDGAAGSGSAGPPGGAGGTESAPGAGGGSGSAGSDGCGGAGQSSGSVAYGSGGGAGGGYYGGGGGGYTFGDGGGGGGAGSSLGPAGAGFAADSTGTPSVTLTPLRLFASIQAGAASLTFPTQAQSTIGAPLTLTIANAQTATAPLQITGLAFTGADPGDFLIGSSTCSGAVQPGQSCQVTLDFAPAAQGERTATLEIIGNDPNGPATVGLSGTGGSLPTGATGPAGAQGAQGVQGPPGPKGAPGKIELVTCRTVSEKVKGQRRQVHKCTGRLVSGTVKFTLAPGSFHATISRNGRVYARGTSVAAGLAPGWLVLNDRRPLTHGRYTLAFSGRRGPHRINRRMTITIA
jgi:hypothetical protein